MTAAARIPLGLSLSLAAIAFAVVAATLAAWTTDDAYISFRYALNLVEGHGLVFNAGGERVQGYTHPLWVLVVALGSWLGATAEAWTQGLGIAAYGISIAVLAYEARRTAHLHRVFVPVAALVGASHRDWAIFATSGLETSWLTMFVTLGFVALRRDLERPAARGIVVGACMGLATVTRPDAGLLAAVVGAVYLLRRREGFIGYALAGLAFVVPMLLAAKIYYGDWLPNPYSAKSSNASWWSQGMRYLQLYAEAYGVLALGPVLLLVARSRRFAARVHRRHGEDPWLVAVALGILVYGGAVVRVGGDFMFARLFVPLTPLLALLLEVGVARLGGVRLALGVTTSVVAVMQLVPRPVTGIQWRYGVADEWEYYDPASRVFMLQDAEALHHATRGIPVRIAFMGGLAGVIYTSRVPWATDAETGLTDRAIARNPVVTRGRPGHEKRPTVEQLLERKIHMVLGTFAVRELHIDAALPVVPIRIGDLEGVLLWWDPEVVEPLRARGAKFPDFHRDLDAILARLPETPDAHVAPIYARLRRFYFDHNDDPERARPFEERLAAMEGRSAAR